ncbi:hypothetical protein H310_07013 [Aphanomyces invadans]|uniref:Uncharacterized protein n=1 Tax=Aphanomyces invadans TaxID=157072 RepID=A0A024U437_9STRA|nr:hypothetical protein H310_07013 [Aphanomyces invadans]ETW00368.1 hypothetical protein H310_07013 [Aphanomyces invadans]|eukprot:XP_008870503.1 hypothetical protein H310_07013 [Aphanomyces invadans]
MSTAGDDGGRMSLKEDEVVPCEAVARAASASEGGGRRSLSSPYEGRRASSTASSDHRQHRPLSVTEKDEVGLLKMENAMLRQKVLAMEQQFEDYAKKDMAEHSDDLDDVNDLLRMAELAKHEAKAYSQNTSRDKMRKDIHILQAILKKAKAERSEFKKAIKLSEERLRFECEKKKEEGLKNEIDKEIFTKIIKDDRDRYRQQVMELTDRIKRLEREKYEVFLWAKHNQDNCMLEMRKLTRALIKAKKMADEQSHDSKELYELTVRVKQVLHMADTTET